MLAGLLAGAFGVQRPSVEVLVPQLVPHDDLPAAAALAGFLGTVSQTGGPLLAGGLLTGGLPLAYAVRRRGLRRGGHSFRQNAAKQTRSGCRPAKRARDRRRVALCQKQA